MKCNLSRKRKKKIRELWEEYKNLYSFEQSLEPMKVRGARIRDKSETLQERKNVQLARSLLRNGVGGDPQSVRKRKIRRGRKPRLLEWDKPPFLEIEELEYSRRPWLHDHYSRVYERVENEPAPVPTERYAMMKRCRRGWSYLPPEIKPRFSPDAQARRAEIKRRIVEISGMKFMTAVLATDECSARRFPEYTRRRRKKREAIRNTETEKRVEKARINLLCERRGERSYREIVTTPPGSVEALAQPRKGLTTGAEDAEEYRRKETTITIAEKLGDQH